MPRDEDTNTFVNPQKNKTPTKKYKKDLKKIKNNLKGISSGLHPKRKKISSPSDFEMILKANQIRPHTSLNGLIPIQAFQKHYPIHVA